MKAKIDCMGNFHIQKQHEGGLIQQDCAFAHAPCGTWCPKFMVESIQDRGYADPIRFWGHIPTATQFQVYTCAQKPYLVENKADFTWEEGAKK